VVLVDVCAEPRGVAVAPDSDVVTVACAGGEIVRVGNGSVLETRLTGVEWRDIRLTAQGLEGTSFRSAEFVTLAPSNVTARVKAAPQRVNTNAGNTALHEAQVAWRMVSAGPKTFLVHQLHANQITVNGSIPDAGFGGNGGSDQNPYGGGSGPVGPNQLPGCANAVVVTAITTIENGGVTAVQRSLDVLPVDAAMSPDGTALAIVGAGGTGLSIYPAAAFGSSKGCLTPTAGLTGLSLHSVAWLSATQVAVVESLRTSPMVFDLSTGQTRMFGTDLDRLSPAHALFHQAPRGGAPLACASCHPEGGEDGHTWVIDGKTRRTQTLSGGVMSRAPFHWQGDLQNLSGLMTDTFVKRMGGTALMVDQVTALGSWLDTIPAPKPSRHLTADELTAGLAAFDKGQCSTCHLAAGTQEGAASDIGTGERVRAPSLSGLFLRAPYLHTGQIPDIRSRVTGTLHPAHGALGNLGPVEREDLIAYLESL
jgi:mono/diheme cytochrome c family protein